MEHELENLLLQATQDAKTYLSFARSGKHECFTDVERDRIKSKYPQFSKYYNYHHWSVDDCLMYPELALTKLFKYTYNEATEPLRDSDIKIGEVVLRIVKYNFLQPFAAHTDIDFSTTMIGSVGIDGEVTINNHTYPGRQSELLGLEKAHPHTFNGNSQLYSFIMLTNAHFSVRLFDGRQVCDLLNTTCYKNE